MSDPVILAAAAVLLMPQLAPSIAPIAVCQTDARITRAAEATDMERADPHRLTVVRPGAGNHMTVRWRGDRHHHRRHRHHR
jgi:hypothetical protein